MFPFCPDRIESWKCFFFNLGHNKSGETMVNAGFALSNEGPWTLRIECKNCSDNTYTTSNLFVPYYPLPRTYTANLKWEF